MLKLEEIKKNAMITGIEPGQVVRVVTTEPVGDNALTIYYKTPDGRSLEITPEVIFQQYYGSRTIHLFFNLWYKDFDYTPALDENGPQIDHIF